MKTISWGACALMGAIALAPGPARAQDDPGPDGTEQPAPAPAPQGAAAPAPAPQQPVYGQPAYGQPAYGQPAYGQPAYAPQPMYAAPPPREPQTRTSPNVGPIVGGAVMLGVAWIANIVVSIPAGDDPFVSGTPVDWEPFRWSGFVPVAGPWIQLGVKPTEFSQDYWAPYLIADGLVQLGGVIMLIVGAATPRTRTVYADVGGGVELAVLPTAGSGQGGLSIVGRF